jgi:uncharacterized protein (TIGR00255 family)
MTQSMTGYAFSTRELPGASLSLELRSVNSRFLDLNFRIPDELRALEPQFRELISAQVSRGKLDCRLAYAIAPSAALPATLNPEVLERLAALGAAVRQSLPDLAPMRLSEVLNWPGVLTDRGEIFEQMRSAGLDLLREALVELVAARGREGSRMAAMISERTAAIRQRLRRLEPLIPQAVAAYQDKVAKRLREALSGAEEARISQEIALFGIKVDVAEEFSRLAAHLDEVDRILTGGPRAGPSGKRLDFLMQELNREVNTLGSKSVSVEISEAVIEFKVMIEQMREQVQNIE